MHQGHRSRRIQRLPSVVLISDEDDDDDVDHTCVQMKEDPDHQLDPRMTTQYYTPTANNQFRSQSISIKEEEEANNRNDITTIDLISPTRSPIGLYQAAYIPYTLTGSNQYRLSILPAYPTSTNPNEQLTLLLSNVPARQLSQQELACRQHHVYPCAFTIVESNTESMSSFLIQQYQLYFTSLIKRLHCDLAILDYNYIRLKNFIQLYRSSYTRILGHHQPSTEVQLNLNENEYAQLLEFYLQIDVDLFYMKTCSFRQAQPRSNGEGLFCINIPECSYTIQRCQKCTLCTPSTSTSSSSSPIQFHCYRKHRFVNGYESILNCPVSCTTNNIIYVLTCPCRQCDYIGETRSHLSLRLATHCYHTNRLIHEGLLGEKNYVQLCNKKTSEMLNKDRMRLYQHPMRCSKAIQLFLDRHPTYWRFVPMTNEEIEQEHRYHSMSIATTTTTTTSMNDVHIQQYLNALPTSPAGYRFSRHQLCQQYEFFEQKLYNRPMSYNQHVYEANIIAVLPLDTSDLFRQMIHSLFVTHTESKLNTMGHLFPSTTNMHIHSGIWCANLLRRPAPSPS